MADPEDPLSAETIREIEQFLDEWLVEERVPGVSVAVMDRDATLYAAGLGARTLDPTEPATPDTRYGVGSVTKPVTAVAILQLIERGDLAFDDVVAQYLPVLGDAPGDPITVADLLRHASGLPQTYIANRDSIADRADLFRHVDRAAARRRVDEDRYMYSNAGYMLLGELVATVDGRAYTEYVEDEIFDPLGMDRSTFDTGILETGDDVMTGYTADGDEFTAGSMDGEAGAAGGLVTSVTDLGKLISCLLNDGSFGGTRLLAPDSVEVLTVRQSPALAMTDGTDRGYGYGWEVGEFMDDWLVEHGGGIFVSGGYVGWLRDREYGVALGFNVDPQGLPVAATGRGILAILAGNDPDAVVRELAARSKIDDVTGTYESAHGEETATVEAGPAGTIEISLSGLDVSFTAAPDAPELGDRTFSAEMGIGERWRAEFDRTMTGMELVVSIGKWSAVLER